MLVVEAYKTGDDHPKRYVRGIAYNQLYVKGAAAPAIPKDGDRRNAVYYDEHVRLPAHHFRKGENTFRYLPVYVEHQRDREPCGRVLFSETVERGDGQCDVGVTLEVWDESLFAGLDSGQYRGLSMGYKALGGGAPGRGSEDWTHLVQEVSLCREPFFPGCNIEFAVAASKDQINSASYISQQGAQEYLSSVATRLSERLRQITMSTEQQQQAAAPQQEMAAPASKDEMNVDSPSVGSSEDLLRQIRELKEENARLRPENELWKQQAKEKNAAALKSMQEYAASLYGEGEQVHQVLAETLEMAFGGDAAAAPLGEFFQRMLSGHQQLQEQHGTLTQQVTDYKKQVSGLTKELEAAKTLIAGYKKELDRVPSFERAFRPGGMVTVDASRGGHEESVERPAKRPRLDAAPMLANPEPSPFAQALHERLASTAYSTQMSRDELKHFVRK